MRSLLISATLALAGFTTTQANGAYAYLPQSTAKLTTAGLHDQPILQNITETSVTVQFRKYILERTPDGFKFKSFLLCNLKGSSPVYDFTQDGVVIIPENRVARCQSEYRGQPVTVNLSFYSYFTNKSPFPTDHQPLLKGYFSHLFVESTHPVIVKLEDFSMASTRDTASTNTILELSTTGSSKSNFEAWLNSLKPSMKPGQVQEGFFAAIEFDK